MDITTILYSACYGTMFNSDQTENQDSLDSVGLWHLLFFNMDLVRPVVCYKGIDYEYLYHIIFGLLKLPRSG